MGSSRRGPVERNPTHPLIEGLRGVLVLVLTTAGVLVFGWLVAVSFSAIFV